MPIYEFKCLKCTEFFETIIMKKDEEKLVECPKCGESEFERVISRASYSMGSGAGKCPGLKTENRSCSSGSCTTYEIPGHSR